MTVVLKKPQHNPPAKNTWIFLQFLIILNDYSISACAAS